MLKKLILIVVVLAVLAFLFMRSLEDTRSDPYAVAPAHIDAWTVEVTPDAAGNAPVLSLRTRPELVSNLSRQIFLRVMESVASPQHSFIPLVLRSEFERAFAGRMTVEELAAAARAAGLDTARPELRCLAHRRQSSGRNVQQVYFVIVQSPAIAAFREDLARRAGGAFDAAALSPVVIVANSESSFERWLPIQATEAECVAPIAIEG